MWNSCTSVLSHSHMGTTRMKRDKEREEEGKKSGVSIESKEGTKNEVPMAHHDLNKIQ